MLKDSILCLLLVCLTVNAIFSRRLLVAAGSLGLTSVLLAVIFFDAGAPFAGGFELSVGAGLVSILFIMAISLAERLQE